MTDRWDGALSQVVPPPEYHDDDVLLSVEPPTASRPTLLLTAAGVGVRAAVELTLTAAGELASMLRTISTAAAAAADFPEDARRSAVAAPSCPARYRLAGPPMMTPGLRSVDHPP